MPRKPRLEAAGGIHHVTSRCTDGLEIFTAVDDCRRFVRLLERASADGGWRVYAYCLMSNHAHLLLQTPEANLGVGMRRVQGMFAQQFNEETMRRGSVWAERFHSRLVRTEAHALQSAAYIVLNPVKAGLVSRPSEWRWSSYRATAGLDPAPSFLAVDETLSWIGPDIDRARTRYRHWIDEAALRMRGQSPPGTVPAARQPRGQSPPGTVPTTWS